MSNKLIVEIKEGGARVLEIGKERKKELSKE